jgi:hypothetical protein
VTLVRREEDRDLHFGVEHRDPHQEAAGGGFANDDGPPF